jgi:cardiolipin synthase
MHDSPSPSASETDNILIDKSAIEQILGLPFTVSNEVRILQSGQETFQTLFEAIRAARRIICIEFYIFKDDDTGNKLAGLLKEKAGEGVEVYLLYDHFGSFLTSRKFWSDLKRAGIHIRVSQPFRWTAPKGYKYRNHKKLLVVDGKIAVTGGFNIADEYHGHLKKHRQAWRDIGIYLSGPIASSLLSMFKKSWSTWKGKAFDFRENHENTKQGIPVIPVFVNSGKTRRRMRKLLLYSIKNAKKSIYISTAYFIPGRKILKALMQASKSGSPGKQMLSLSIMREGNITKCY